MPVWTDDGGGDTWLKTYLEQLFRYGKREKLAICGTSALLGINNLVEGSTHYTMTAATKSYGIAVTEWITPFGKINLMTHPLFSQETTLRNSMLILEPENLKYRYIDDTTFYSEGNPKAQSTSARVDGTEEEFLTEAGLEFHHPSTMMFLNGVGKNNEV